MIVSFQVSENGKIALVKFKTHDICSAHCEAVMKLAHFRKGTDVAGNYRLLMKKEE